MAETSAGIVLYRRAEAGIEVLLVHPGGPFWTRRDEAAWSIPKGLVEPGEDVEAAALREFTEETGYAPGGRLAPLGSFRQQSGKTIVAYSLEGQFDPAKLKSNTFLMAWPPKSGKMQEFPEADRAGWFDPEAARLKLVKGQVPILEALLAALGG